MNEPIEFDLKEYNVIQKELEEKLKLPIVKCSYLDWFRSGVCTYSINFSGKNNYISNYISCTLEENGNFIITDDFIFEKEGGANERK